MPELPEVESLRLSLEPLLLGRRFDAVRVRDTRLRRPVDRRTLGRDLRGARVQALSRRAKYLLVHLDRPQMLVVHLGMSGQLLALPRHTRLDPHDHVLLGVASVSPTAAPQELRYRDPRRFGMVLTLPEATWRQHPLFRHLGPEPLEAEFGGELLAERARGSRRPVKNFIMDAQVVVGVGNIYASEALHAAGIHPTRPAGRISAARWDRLAVEIKRLLRQSIARGGTTLSDYRDAEGRRGSNQGALVVYGREGEPCEGCGAAIRRRVQQNRSTFYCPRCQR
jgi:formamidopyrimidine-DNA glycosylase